MSVAIRVTPTSNEGTFFVQKLTKKDGEWKKDGPSIPMYVNEDTKVLDLMEQVA